MEFEECQLPVELKDIIVDYLTDDKPALQALSLTNQQFRALAQPRVLRDVILKLYTRSGTMKKSPSKSTPNRFLDMLNASPHIAPYIHSISIVESDGSTSQLHVDSATKAMKEILSRTICLRSLWFPVLSCPCDIPDVWSWELVDKGLQDLFIQFYRREVSGYREIDLRKLFHVPGTLLSSFRNVRSLRISPLSPPKLDGKEDESVGHHANVLDTLELSFEEDYDTWGSTLEFLCSPKSCFDLTKLNTLITSSFVSSNQLDTIFSLCSETLQHLVLRMGRDTHSMLQYKDGTTMRNYIKSIFDLSNLKRLSRLTVIGSAVDVVGVRGQYSTPAPWIGDLLTSFTKSPAFASSFQELKLEFELVGIRPGGFPCLNWEPVVRALVDNFHNSRMHKIIFKFWIHDVPNPGRRRSKPTSAFSRRSWRRNMRSNVQLEDLRRETGLLSIC